MLGLYIFVTLEMFSRLPVYGGQDCLDSKNRWLQMGWFTVETNEKIEFCQGYGNCHLLKSSCETMKSVHLKFLQWQAPPSMKDVPWSNLNL